ncbi:MAG: glycosyltransferase [Planctomycetota bacterium]
MQAETTRAQTLAVVVPVYSGQDYLAELVDELASVKSAWEQAGAPISLVEAIFVDDCSRDRSLTVLRELEEQHSWVRVVTLSRNFGQHPATVAGVLHSSADWIATLDEDLQHPPERIEELLRAAVFDERDVVYAHPKEHVHQSAVRDLGSRGYKGLLALLTGNKHIRSFNSFRLLRGSVARAAASVCGHETYFDIAIGWFTNAIGQIDLDIKDRRMIAGARSGYSIWRLLSHARRLIVSSQTKTLRIGGAVGVVAILIAFVMAINTLVNRYTGTAELVQGWASTFLAILFFGGVSCFLLGVLLEYVTSVLLHAQGKPTYFAVDRTGDRTLREYFEDRS